MLRANVAVVFAVGAALGALGALAGCERDLDRTQFQRRAEKTFVEVNPGWGIVARKGAKSTLARGDQLFELDTGPLFDAYKAGGKTPSAFFDMWSARLSEEAHARRRTIDQAAKDLVPVVKSGSWIRVQDLGAIGPKRVQDQIRPWRKEIASDVFALIGVPEELLGLRYASVAEVASSSVGADLWLERAVSNLARRVATSTEAQEMRGDDGRLLIYELAGVPEVSGVILDRRFRKQMLSKFGKPELGAAIPNRDVLIVFDNNDFVALRPTRARTHQLYDARNHPAFRGLLRFDADTLSVLEPAQPDKPKP